MSNLRLSEAIRLGSMLRPQAFGVLFDGRGTCANGAACEALGWKPNIIQTWKAWEDGREEALKPSFDLLTTCPVTGIKSSIGLIVPNLNNEPNCWTRERIADFVEQIEREHGLIPDALPDARAIEDAVASGQPASSANCSRCNGTGVETDENGIQLDDVCRWCHGSGSDFYERPAEEESDIERAIRG